MTAIVLSVAMVSVVAIQLGIVFLILNRLITGHWWTRSGSARAVNTGFHRLRLDTVRLLRQQQRIAGDTKDSSERDLLIRLWNVQQNLESEDRETAAEALQWFQWEVFRARVQGALSRQASIRLIEDAQALSEEIQARDHLVDGRKPSAAE